MSYTITPNSNIYFVSTKLEDDYENTFNFPTKQDQTNYFNSLINTEVSFNDCTYVKKDGYIVVPLPMDSLISYNYLFYNNGGFPNNRRYYCFITKMEYVSENDTRVFFKTDVMQTYLYDLEWNTCFVEREHVNNDTRGLHTLQEGLETGDYVCNGDMTIVSLTTDEITSSSSPRVNKAHIVIGTTTELLDLSNIGGTTYNGIYAGVKYYVIKDKESAELFIQRFCDEGKEDTIVTIFMAPDALTGYADIGVIREWQQYFMGDGKIIYYYPVISSNQSFPLQVNPAVINKPNSCDGYVPKNNKLLCYPYNYLEVTNFNGGDTQYRYEYFNAANIGGIAYNDNQCVFQARGALTPSCSIENIPLNYENQNGWYKSKIFSIPCAKFPQCSWDSDEYTNWLTQNGANIAVSIAAGIAEIALGAGEVAVGAGIGGFTGGLGSAAGLTAASAGVATIAKGGTAIASTLASNYQHSLVPNSVNGVVNNGDISFSSGHIGFGYYPMSIRREFAIVLDNYFSMYGYKVNTLKVPNINGRRYWNYVKTIKCNVDGNIPQEDLQTIRQAIDGGITFWHDPANIYNYNLNNSIV